MIWDVIYSTTAKMSLSFTIIKSSPSYFTSVPEYLLTTTLSPFFTSTGTTFPSSFNPGPTAITFHHFNNNSVL